MTIQCSKCKRVRHGETWHAPDRMLRGPVSHSYCPHCFLEVRVEYFAEAASHAALNEATLLSDLLGAWPAPGRAA
jgi:hypothetical protein